MWRAAARALAALALFVTPVEARNLALLVGVSAYDDAAIRSLEGPRNDVVLMREALARRDFGAQDVEVLADGAPDSKAAPTRAAILAGLQGLADKAGAGDLVVFHYSGHGSTQPEGPVEDGAEPEPGGRVQVLLPRDAGRYDEATHTIRNAIIDKELGRALERIRAKGARLFVVIDACHAGTVTRAGAGVARAVEASALGVPDAASSPVMAAAPTRRAAVKAGQVGALVGFFAVDAWSEALERPLPAAQGEGATRVYGAFTWHLARVLAQGRARSYRDLARLAALDMTRASASLPPPMFEGDLDATLPGAGAAGPPRFEARIEGGKVTIEAGRLQGIEPGARLGLYDGPVADARRLGGVEAVEAGAASSRAEGGALAPGRAWAQIEAPGASFRLRVAASPDARAALAGAAEGLPVDFVEGAADHVAVVAQDRVWLGRDGAASVDPDSVPSAPANDAAALRALVWRLARAANLARLAAAADVEPASAPAARVSLTVTRETDPTRLSDPRRACSPPRRPDAREVDGDIAQAVGHCDLARLAIENVSERDLDVGVFLIDPMGEVATPSRDWARNGCVAYLPARAGRPLVVRTQLQMRTQAGLGHAGLHRVLVFALPRQGGMPVNLCPLVAEAPPAPDAPALRAASARGFAGLLARAGLADPTLRAANPFAEEDAQTDAGVLARQYLLDLRPAGR